MAESTVSHNGSRTGALYTIPEAARLAHVSSQTVRRWLHGYDTPKRHMGPVFGEPRERPAQTVEVSFLQLIEIYVASQFRKRRISLQRVRSAHDFAANAWQLDFPFARLKLSTDGPYILTEYGKAEPGRSLVVLESGQATLPGHVSEAIKSFEFDDDDALATRWYPVGKSVPIVIDPRYSAGLPTIPERRVTIGAIRKRFLIARQRIQFIAEDFQLEPETVEEVLRYAEQVAAWFFCATRISAKVFPNP